MGMLKTMFMRSMYCLLVLVSTVQFLFFMLVLTLRYSPKCWFRKSKRTQRPPVMDRPELGTHGFIQTEEVELHYVAAGDRNKPLILFVHGFPECWYSWRHQMVEFKKDYRVVAIDCRGFSESQKPKLKNSYLVNKVAGDLKNVLSQLGYSSCTLVGHDWGGIVCWYFAAEYPDLVDKLIIMNAPHPLRFESALKSSLSQVIKSLYVFFYQIPWIPEMMISCNDFGLFNSVFIKKGDPNNTKEDCEAFKFAMAQPGALTAALNYYRANMKYPMPVKIRDSILCPTLIVWGMADKFLNWSLVEGTEKYVTDLTIKKVPGGDHFVQQDKPAEVNKHMWDFLQGDAEEKENPLVMG